MSNIIIRFHGSCIISSLYIGCFLTEDFLAERSCRDSPEIGLANLSIPRLNTCTVKSGKGKSNLVNYVSKIVKKSIYIYSDRQFLYDPHDTFAPIFELEPFLQPLEGEQAI